MKIKLEELTDDELLQEAKTIKPYKLYDAVIVGVLIGIAGYSTIVNGFGLFTFLPLVYLPIAKKNMSKKEEVRKLLKERNLQ